MSPVTALKSSFKILSVLVLALWQSGFCRQGDLQDLEYKFQQTITKEKKSIELSFDHSWDTIGVHLDTIAFNVHSLFPFLSKAGLGYSFGYLTFNDDYENDFGSSFFQHRLNAWGEFQYSFFETSVGYSGLIETFPGEDTTGKHQISLSQAFQKKNLFLEFYFRNDFYEKSFFNSTKYIFSGGYGIFKKYWIFFPVEWLISGENLDLLEDHVRIGLSAEIPVWNLLLYPKVSFLLNGEAMGGIGFDYFHSQKYPRIYGNVIVDHILSVRFKLGLSYAFSIPRDSSSIEKGKRRAQRLKEYLATEIKSKWKDRKKNKEREKIKKATHQQEEPELLIPAVQRMAFAPLYNGTELSDFDAYSEITPALMRSMFLKKDKTDVINDNSTKNWLSFYGQRDKQDIDPPIRRLLREEYKVDWLVLSRFRKYGEVYYLIVDFHHLKNRQVIQHEIIMNDPSRKNLQEKLTEWIETVVLK